MKIFIKINMLTVFIVLFAATFCFGQNYPSRSITMILPLPVGSAIDVLMRNVAPKMGESLGQQINIENIPGAGGMIGGERVARSAPDGYTIGGFAETTVNAVPLLYPNVPYDPFTSFTPVSSVAWVTFVLMTHPSLPVKTTKDFLAIVKASKSPLDYASGGNGSAQHIGMELFKFSTGIRLNHIPYRGQIGGVLDVIGGRVPVMLTSLAAVLEQIKAGKLRAIGIASSQRSLLLPEIATISESGVSHFVYSTWQAIYLPRGAERTIVERLNMEIVKAVNNPLVHEKLIQAAMEPATSTPDQLAHLTRTGYDKTARIIKLAGIKAD